MKNFLSAWFVSLCVLLWGCRENKKEERVVPVVPVAVPVPDTLSVKKEMPEKSPLKIAYRFTTVNDSVIKYFQQEEMLAVILALNRIDFSRFHPGDTLVIPDTLFSGLRYYSPFPDSISLIRDIKKLLLFSETIQAFAAYENGMQVRWGPTSMGKQSTPTPSGLFHTNWKAKQTVSTENPEWILNWYFNIVNFRGISLHQYELPGYPASHSCARLAADDAQWIYHWAEQWILTPDEGAILAYGTPVVIFGAYRFGEPRPWFELAENPSANFISSDTIENVISPHLAFIHERQAQRDSVAFASANH